MLAHQFPDLHWLKRQANTSFADRKSMSGVSLPFAGWPNVIMNARASDVTRDHIKGPLSLFANLSGHSTITVEKYRVPLAPGTFFLSNADQYYTLEIGKQKTETANIHFGERFSLEAFRSMRRTYSELLEENADEPQPTFYNRVVRSDEAFKIRLAAALVPGQTQLEEDQRLFDILEYLVRDEQQVRRQEDQLRALKQSTKSEIMRRLLRATDYLHSTRDAQPDLNELARVSCLSKFHFLRLFKIAFGKTPHQYITSLKVEQAKHLLLSTTIDAREISSSLGYKDASTFSRQFCQHVGVYPTQYRSGLR